MTYGRGARAAVAAALLVGAVAGLAMPALAHAVLESTDPPSGTAVARSPGEVVLHFDEQVSISPSAAEVFNSSGKRVDSGATKGQPSWALHRASDGPACVAKHRPTAADRLFARPTSAP
ncbi:MAG TPA: copper resistance protein CopC [Acidimicrobiales bacterium]|nr:copper resistance protein CopC [Acidimicrobiales bacterium]